MKVKPKIVYTIIKYRKLKKKKKPELMGAGDFFTCITADAINF